MFASDKSMTDVAICSICKQQIIELTEMLKLSSGAYHLSCLGCECCGASSISTELYCYHNYSEIKDSSSLPMVCKECLQKQTKKCNRCKIPFNSTEDAIRFDNKYFHAACFRCARCGQSIGTNDHVKDDRASAWCILCFRSHNPEIALFQRDNHEQHCDACKQVLIDSQFLIQHHDRIFHLSCFVCDNCNKKLDLNDLYKSEIGKCGVACKACYQELEPKCTRCSMKLDSVDYFLIWKDNRYHIRCFECDECCEGIVSPEFRIMKNMKLCCDCAPKSENGDLQS
ncbi:hypothetical protein ACOME3_004167 [Neoechinorhynchus agilis]